MTWLHGGLVKNQPGGKRREKGEGVGGEFGEESRSAGAGMDWASSIAEKQPVEMKGRKKV